MRRSAVAATCCMSAGDRFIRPASADFWLELDFWLEREPLLPGGVRHGHAPRLFCTLRLGTR